MSKQTEGTERRQVTQPKEWWGAFKAQADREGLTLSEWLGECGWNSLDTDLREGLPERAKRGPRTKGGK